MKKPIKLFKQMQGLVDMYVKHYSSDFNVDKDCIMGNYPEFQSPSGVYYWYLRECGTQLMSIENLAWKETADFINAKYWLSQALAIFRLDVNAQTLSHVPPARMQDIISRAKNMDTGVKLDYIIRRMEVNKSKNISPNELLCNAINAYKLTDSWQIGNMIKDPRLTFENAIKTLFENRLALEY